jgi:hypothetical protein
MAGELEIDWSSAEVSDGELTVALSGKATAGWTDAMEHTLARLGRPGGGWGEIAVGKKKLKVEAVSPGAESDLRHLLESAALQANTSAPPEPDADDAPRSDADEEMTRTFRAFG